MTNKEVRDLFVQQLAPHLPGFSPRKKNGSFVRKIPGGAQEIGLSLIDYRPKFVASLVFTIRLEQVQDIIHAVLGTPPRYQKMTVTTATVLDHFFPREGRKEFVVTSPAEIAAVVQELAPHLRDRIVPFLESHQDVKALDAVMNSEEGTSFDRTNPPYRQMTALILAYTARNPSFEDLVARFDEEAKRWHERDRKNLNALVAYLRGASSPPTA